MTVDDDSVYHFSAAAIRRDPILARAPENQLFQFFCSRSRKINLPGWFRSMLIMWMGFLLLGLLIDFFGPMSGKARLLLWYAIFPVVGGITMALYVRSRQLALKQDDSKFYAASATSLIDFHRGMRRNVLIDLWLAGARGSDLAEAIYLETRRRECFSNPIVVLSVMILLAGASVAACGGGEFSDYYFAFGVLNGGWLLFRSLRYGGINSATQTVARHGRQLNAKVPSLEWGTFDRFLRFLLFVSPALVIVIIMMHASDSLIVPFARLFSRINQATDLVVLTRMAAGFCAVWMGVAFFLAVKPFQELDPAPARRVFDAFDPAFDRFVREQLLSEVVE